MKGKVLVVDDDPIMGTVLKTRLSKAGFQTSYFSTGTEALGKVLEINPDLIISDIVMPNMDGYELHRCFRKNPQTANIPFVFLSARKEVDDQLEGLRLGADDYICKPFEFNDLLIRMEKVMIRAAKARSFQTLADFSGNLAQMNLNDIIQIVEMNYKSGELIIQDAVRSRLGSIYFKEGILINAQKAALEGENAFFDLMEIEEGYFEFYGRDTQMSERIMEGNMSVLLKGSRLLDESRDFYADLAATTIIPVLKTPHIPKAVADKLESGHLKQVLEHLNGLQSIQDLINSGKIGKVILGAVIGNLYQAGLIQFKIKKPAQPKPPTNCIVMKEGLLRAVTDIAQRRFSGVIEIKGLSSEAAIMFSKGQLINAGYGVATGKKALYRLFGEKPLHIAFLPKPVADKPVITEEIDQLINEGMREAESYVKLEPSSFDKILRVHPSFDDDLLTEQHSSEQDNFLPLVKKYGKIKDIIDASPLTDMRTYELLFHLVNMKILEITDEERIEIQLVIDSGCDLPPELIEKYDITLVPMAVSFGPKIYYDGINLKPERFYDLLSQAEQTPTISTPNVDEFHSVFKDIVEDKDILAMFMASEFCDVYRNAQEAKDRYFFSYLEQRNRKNLQGEDFNMALIDSQTVSLGAGLMILEAAEKIAEGWPFHQIHAHLEQLLESVHVLMIPSSLDNLRKAGWLPRDARPPDKTANTRSILMLRKGKLEIIDQLMPQETESHKLTAIIRAALDHPDIRIKAAIMHGNRPDWASAMTAHMEKSFSCAQIITAAIGPAIGTVLGAGAFAVAYFPVDQNHA